MVLETHHPSQVQPEEKGELEGLTRQPWFPAQQSRPNSASLAGQFTATHLNLGYVPADKR